MKKFMLGALAVALGGAAVLVPRHLYGADPDKARPVLEDLGFVNIEWTGWDPHACGLDFYAVGFIARHPANHTVKGTVCCGAFSKGCEVHETGT